MVRLSAHDRTRHAEAGFTMVEVLIVVFIIALMSAVVVMNLPAAKPEAVSRADALVRDLNRASHEAIVSGEPVALAVRGGAYRFERYRAGFWSPTGAVIRDILHRLDDRFRASPVAGLYVITYPP